MVSGRDADRLDRMFVDFILGQSRVPQSAHRPLSIAGFEVTTEGRVMGPFGVMSFLRPPVIPFAAIDPRIMDLALVFWKNPDNS